MRILVTGAAGFVGQHLTCLLRSRGEDVTEWRFSDGDAGSGVQLDLCDARAVVRQDVQGVEAIVHLAGLAQVSRSFSEPQLFMSVNTAVVTNLFESLLAQHSRPRILLVSTGGVYSADAEPITEDSPVAAANPYEVSKLAQEMLAAYYMQRGLEVIVVRPFNHIGPGQQPGYLVPDICSQVASLERAGGGTITVGNLGSARDYTDVRDVVAAYHSLLEHGRSGETYNVCSGVAYTGEEILKRICSLSTVELTVESSEALHRPTEVSTIHASNAKLRDDTHWAPAIPLDQTLADTLAYWRDRS
ncbi:MAG: NAD-dependent epimerase/dehydratase family protein [Solirubrobacteraceae bacterium]